MMILFFSKDDTVFAVQTKTELSGERLARLKWLFGNADYLDTLSVEGDFIGPRR